MVNQISPFSKDAFNTAHTNDISLKANQMHSIEIVMDTTQYIKSVTVKGRFLIQNQPRILSSVLFITSNPGRPNIQI